MNEREYDYIVVGAGTAGCVLAARLSEDPRARVLLLEAGSATPLPAMAVPPVWPTLKTTAANWGDATVVQSETGASIPFPRGRALGGSSAINGMLFARGHRASYDVWPQGWGFDVLLPYFQRSEHTEGRDPAVRGVGGPLRVRPAVSRHPVIERALAAAVEVGYPATDDISGGLQEGFGWCDENIVDGRRQSAADAYLAPARHRPNLDIVTDALALRLRMNGDRCVGVEYSVDTRVFTALCSMELVLAAGTIGSPQLLMLSGIGPREPLRRLGIDVVLDLPGVGENLHDHPITGVVYRASKAVPPGVNGHGEAIGLLRTDSNSSGPDLQILFVDMPRQAHTRPAPEHGYSIRFSVMSPRSRGAVRLASANPGTAPLVDPRYYSDPRDFDVMIAGLRIARAIGRATSLASWRDVEWLPGPDVGDEDEDAMRAYLRTGLMSYCHPVGTCRMGLDDMAVVDLELRVRGIRGLRVVDASVMPSIVSANTNATVYAIAERAADLVKR